MTHYLIDAHQDLAYNILAFGRDYSTSAANIRASEAGTGIPELAGQTLLGWQDYQAGRVAVIFGTLFSAPKKYQHGQPDNVTYSTPAEAYSISRAQMDAYVRLSEEHPDKFRLILTREDLHKVTIPWEESRDIPLPDSGLPVGIVVSMESAEGLYHVEEVEEWWQLGVRWIGPVWAGTRFCGGTREQMPFTREGFDLLERMAEQGFGLDVAHMSDLSIQTALDRYPGTVICSHGNVRSVLKGGGERQLTDLAIRRLAERDGVVGVVPFNKFLKADWTRDGNREEVTLDHLLAHIDAICQLTGSPDHAGIGTDFDGLFGYPDVPLEINTIADMQKLAQKLLEKGYTLEDVQKIFHGNWLRMLERILPA